MAGRLYVGTSGFGYDEWRGVFYPPGLKPKERLSFYAGRFNSVEINYTFRRLPEEDNVRAWRASTPDGFAFALKASRRITHLRRLAGVDEAVALFLERARLLGPKLGAILFQCPPTLPFEPAALESLLANLPPTLRYAFEFRHPSWAAARALLAALGAAWCVADTDEAPYGGRDVPATPFAYLRLRRTMYREEDLERWAERISTVLQDGRDVFAYHKHEEEGRGPAFAERLRAIVEGGRPGAAPLEPGSDADRPG